MFFFVSDGVILPICYKLFLSPFQCPENLLSNSRESFFDVFNKVGVESFDEVGDSHFSKVLVIDRVLFEVFILFLGLIEESDFP